MVVQDVTHKKNVLFAIKLVEIYINLIQLEMLVSNVQMIAYYAVQKMYANYVLTMMILLIQFFLILLEFVSLVFQAVIYANKHKFVQIVH